MDKKNYTIGRAGDVKLNDETVSRHHACLEVDGDVLVLRDLDSRNGTYEVLGQELKPFSVGPVTSGQVFAFGECVRSVAQLLKTAKLQEALAGGAAKNSEKPVDDPLDTTHIGSAVAPRGGLSTTNIIEMLDRAEDELAHGRTTNEVCMNLGITIPRYERWCREYGATRRERERSLLALQRENEHLRKLVANLSDRHTDGAGPAGTKRRQS